MSQIGGKKKSIYVLLLVAAGIALAVDRLYLKPSAAEAEQLNSRPVTVTDRQVQAKPHGPPIAPIFEEKETPSYSQNKYQQLLQAFVQKDGMRDAFSMSPDMNRHYQTMEEKQRAKEQANGEMDAEQARYQILENFAQNCRLQATCLDKGDSWVILNGMILTHGDEVEGFKLIRIERYRAVFEKDGDQVVLSLPMPFESKVIVDEPR